MKHTDHREQLTKPTVWLVYDGKCPVCTSYCKYLHIRAAAETYNWPLPFLSTEQSILHPVT